ncbi:MAG: lactate racemase domain-containing protein [Verrucomicrobiota bacterium]
MTGRGGKGLKLDEAAVRALCSDAVARWSLRGKRVLAIVPDNTRTAPIDLMFRVLDDEARGAGATAFDVLIALGTHPPMSDEAINQRLGLTPADRAGKYAQTRVFNHRWNDPAALVSIGAISEDEVAEISGGRMRERVDVTINRLALSYDLLLIIGPTFPHEVVGYSGGNKYLFPGIAGQEILDMFHWLGALITNPSIIGTKYTPVRAVVDRAAALVPVERKCASLVVEGIALAGLYLGSPEETWEAAATLSSQIHVIAADRAYRSVLSCAPPMYDELWVGGKCAYKLEPVVADGGEIVIYAPHIHEISVVHGRLIREIGYHVRDYFVKQPGRFDHVPRGVLAHSTHVKGIGTFEGGVERPRITVTLATGIPEAECRAVNLGYRDHRTIDAAEWKNREAEGYLYVPKAGETLYRLKDDPFTTTTRRP